MKTPRVSNHHYAPRHESTRFPADRKPMRLFAWLAVLCLPAGMASAQALQPGFFQEQLGDLGGGQFNTRAWGVAVADFNNDGLDDIIAGDTAGDVHLFIGDGAGNFTRVGVVIDQSFNDAYSLVAGDFTGDGNADFILARTTDLNEGQLHLYPGNGDGTFQSTGSIYSRTNNKA